MYPFHVFAEKGDNDGTSSRATKGSDRAMSTQTKQQRQDQSGNEQQESGTAIAVVTDEQTALAQWQQSTLPCATSLDTRTNDGMSRAISAMGNSDAAGKDRIGKDIAVADWLVHLVPPIVADDGSEGGKVRLVLITEAGERIATRAPAVIDRWRMIVSAARLLKWRWPIIITLGLHPIGKGMSYLEITSQRPS